MRKQWAHVGWFLCTALLAGCGSGSHNFVTPPPPPPPPTTQAVTVTVSPATVSVLLGAPQQFSSTVANTTNTAVTWQVGGVTGGNQIVGTISSNGLYTAPANLPAQTDIEIKAISAADTNAFGKATAKLTKLNQPNNIYISSGPDDDIQIFSVDSTGIPKPISTVSVGSGKNPVSLAMHPSGKFLYSLNRGSSEMSIFTIDDVTGDLTAAGTVATPDGPYAAVFSAAGDFVYVSCDNASAVAAFAVNTGTGALSPINGSPYVLGGRVQGLTTSVDGKFLYVTDSARNQIIGMAVNPSDGTLSELAGSPFGAGAGVASIVVTEGYAYAANRDIGTIGTYTLDASSGSLTLTSSLSSGGSTPELFSSSAAGFLLGVNSGSDNYFSFELDGDLYAYGPPVSTGAQPLPGGSRFNPAYYPWSYVLNRGSATSAASIGVYYVYYDGVSANPLATVPTGSSNPTGFAITP